jgi:DNA-binding transcriptional LysR family regulator
MELYQLRTFVSVADEGNLSRAAKKLHASQPAVSAHIKSLEEELGVLLFERTPKGMRLTLDGARLKKHAERVLASADEVLDEARALREQVGGTLRVGLNTDPVFLRTVELLDSLTAHWPHLELHFAQDASGKLLDRMEETGGLDGAFVFGDQARTGFETMFLRNVPLLIAGPAAWKDRVEGASWADICAMPWIRTPEYCPYCELLNRTFAKHGVEPNLVLSADNEMVMLAMTLAGKGFSLLREDEAAGPRNAGRIVVWESDTLSIPLLFTWPHGRENHRPTQALLGAVREVWPEARPYDQAAEATAL